MLQRVVTFLLACGLGLAGAQAPACAPGSVRIPGGWRPPLQTAAFADPAIPAALTAGYRKMQSPQAAQHPAAAADFQRARTAALAAHDDCGEALAAFALGNLTERDNFDQADRWYTQAAAAFAAAPSPLGVAETHFRLASVHALQGHEKQSHQEYLAASRELEQAGAMVDAISAHVASLDTASADAEYAALQRQAHGLGSGCEEADIFRLWGDHAFTLQHYQDAMQHYQAARRLFAPCSADAALRAYLETSMGRLERAQGRPAAALPHYQLALKFQRQSGNLTYLPQTYNAIAVAYEAMGDIPHAITYYQRGLTEAQRLHSQPFMDFLGANLGSTYARHGQPQRGIPLLEAATAHLKSDFLVCIRADQLGDAYRDVGRLPDAAAQLDRAVAACGREDARASLTGALDDRAQLELQRVQLDAAWADVRRALGLVEESRAHLVTTDAYKAGYISVTDTRDTYNLAVTVLMRGHHAQQALEVAEQGRSRALLDLLASGDAAADHASRLDPARGGLASPSHAAALDYAGMMAQAARLHSTLVAYWLTNSQLFTWVARPGRPVLGVAQSIVPDQLTALVRASLSETASPATWRQLYQLLIAPVEAALPDQPGARLTIVPSGPLFRVAFAALTDARDRYLIERYDLHSTPTVGLLQYTESDAAAAARRPARYLFLAAPAHPAAPPDGHPLPPLPGAAAEARAISQLLAPAGVTALLGDNATPARLLAAAPRATVLDFATHAFVDDAQPEKTYLALEGAGDRGRFTLDDVYRLRLDARLVVLEACRTGLGKISGDGVAGFSRAFFFAGAASVMATLWDIADRPTSVMLPHFYTALRAGQPPSEALRTAQLQMIRDLRAGAIRVPTLRGAAPLPPSPRYWAGFTLFGEP